MSTEGGVFDLQQMVSERVEAERKKVAEQAAAASASPLVDLQRHLDGIRAILEGEMKLIEAARVQLVRERQKLDEEWRLLDSERLALRQRFEAGEPPAPPVGRSKTGVVQLNVGGTPFTTTIATLMAEPASGLAALFKDPARLPRDPDGRLFLDCAAGPFMYILKYLRGERFMVRRSDPDLPDVYQQAQLFGLSGFVRMLDDVVGGGQLLPQQSAAPAVDSAGQPANSAPHSPPTHAASPPPQSPPSRLPSASPARSATRQPATPQTPRVPALPDQQSPVGRLGAPDAALAAPQESPARFIADASLHAPLLRALERQRRREAEAARLADSESRVGAEQQQQAVATWEQYWTGMAAGGSADREPTAVSV
eukprot:TRINITY_DN12580_c0_g1_i2.p1 TRINITY_DN12580_c0_g1~~TRINITY_DN12580_c0_g1_i2.p1  ORF type:complete len:368 (+),score=126.90 TRINITY_DN12580_c0_g1_i2:52-1155(+)